MKTKHMLAWIAGLTVLAWVGMEVDAAGLPPGVSYRNGYLPGNGAPVGVVQLVQGTVFIIHSGDQYAYQAKRTFDLYEDDTLITGDDGKISFKLNDGSILSLTRDTRLVINQSVYDPDKKARTSFFSMTVGKARFWVRKLAGFKQSDFKVKTKTAVVGVRGSDFVVEATEEFTRISALEKTDLAVVSLIGPDQPPRRVTDFQEVLVMQEALPSMAEEIMPEEAEQLKREFEIPDAWKESGEPERPTVSKGLFIAEEDILAPGAEGPALADAGGIEAELFTPAGQEQGMEEDFEGQKELVYQDILEDTVEPSQADLPDFPGEPESLPGFPDFPSNQP